MPKAIPSADLAAVQAVVAQYAEGVGIEVLQEMLAGTPRRSLQRRLAELVRSGRLIAEGRGRARRYRVAPAVQVVRADGIPPVAQPSVAAAENYVPLSQAGAEIRALVQRPIAARTPVGYNRDFLDGYIPNTTKYLSEPVRQRLHELGRS